MEELKYALRNALISQFGADEASLGDDSALFSSGLIDSLSVIELVGFVERQIGRRIPPAAITLDNFDSIARIVAFARALTARRDGA